MTRIAPRFATIVRAACVAMLAAAPVTAVAATPAPPMSDAAQPSGARTVEGWSAMVDVSLAEILAKLDDLPLSEQASHEQPYCASDDEIALTLRHDFAEEVVLTAGAEGTEIWASELMGTWTVVAPRMDETSCIVASGIGFSPRTDAEVYYSSLGL